MKFKVGDRVQKTLEAGFASRGVAVVQFGTVVGVGERNLAGSYEVRWELPNGPAWRIESSIGLEASPPDDVVVPRALLEEIRVLLNYFDGMQSSRNQSLGVCRAAIHVLLESK